MKPILIRIFVHPVNISLVKHFVRGFLSVFKLLHCNYSIIVFAFLNVRVFAKRNAFFSASLSDFLSENSIRTLSCSGFLSHFKDSIAKRRAHNPCYKKKDWMSGYSEPHFAVTRGNVNLANDRNFLMPRIFRVYHMHQWDLSCSLGRDLLIIISVSNFRS